MAWCLKNGINIYWELNYAILFILILPLCTVEQIYDKSPFSDQLSLNYWTRDSYS